MQPRLGPIPERAPRILKLALNIRHDVALGEISEAGASVALARWGGNGDGHAWGGAVPGEE